MGIQIGSKTRAVEAVQFHPDATRIAAGFHINKMFMKNGETGRIMWEELDWKDAFSREIEAHIPASILRCKFVNREIEFFSKELIQNLRIRQRFLLGEDCVEEWNFVFGFVIPNSTNTWSNEIEAASPDQMLPIEMMSGKLRIQTEFFDGDKLINRSYVRLYYIRQ